MGQWVLQVWVSQLITNVPDWGPPGSWHLHVSHRLEETTAPGWAVGAAGAGEHGLGLAPCLPHTPAPGHPMPPPTPTPGHPVPLGGPWWQSPKAAPLWSRVLEGPAGSNRLGASSCPGQSWGLRLASALPATPEPTHAHGAPAQPSSGLGEVGRGGELSVLCLAALLRGSYLVHGAVDAADGPACSGGHKQACRPVRPPPPAHPGLATASLLSTGEARPQGDKPMAGECGSFWPSRVRLGPWPAAPTHGPRAGQDGACHRWAGYSLQFWLGQQAPSS